MKKNGTRLFAGAGDKYAKFRPSYPPELITFLTESCHNHKLAIDVGCGTGQLSKLLSPIFKSVTGLDVNQSQLDNAFRAENIEYLVSAESGLPVASASADFIGCAQAAHWFDLSVFYQDCRRIARKDCLLSLITYGVPEMTGEVGALFSDFYWHKIHRYWPPERRHVETAYAEFDFPFSVVEAPKMVIRRQVLRHELLGYIGTWSAIRAMRQAGEEAILNRFEQALTQIWDAPNMRREIIWPLTAKSGRIE